MEITVLHVFNLIGSEGGPMFICVTCSKLEQQCKCDRFCMLCQSDFQVRLCEDGYYYCKDCRDACDFRSEE
jgi:hypothetical protein